MGKFSLLTPTTFEKVGKKLRKCKEDRKEFEKSECSTIHFKNLPLPTKFNQRLIKGEEKYERGLEKFFNEKVGTHELELELNTGNDLDEWDQFAANRKLFNIEPSFDESKYTTTLHLESLSRKQLKEADLIAKSIESAPSKNFHVQEDRGQLHKDGENSKAGEEEDEEMKYSAVMGTGAYKNIPDTVKANKQRNNENNGTKQKEKEKHSADSSSPGNIAFVPSPLNFTNKKKEQQKISQITHSIENDLGVHLDKAAPAPAPVPVPAPVFVSAPAYASASARVKLSSEELKKVSPTNKEPGKLTLNPVVKGFVPKSLQEAKKEAGESKIKGQLSVAAKDYTPKQKNHPVETLPIKTLCIQYERIKPAYLSLSKKLESNQAKPIETWLCAFEISIEEQKKPQIPIFKPSKETFPAVQQTNYWPSQYDPGYIATQQLNMYMCQQAYMQDMMMQSYPQQMIPPQTGNPAYYSQNNFQQPAYSKPHYQN